MQYTNYESELTEFINQIKNVPRQKQLMQTWWDKDPIDLDEQAHYRQVELKPDAYPYFTYGFR